MKLCVVLIRDIENLLIFPFISLRKIKKCDIIILIFVACRTFRATVKTKKYLFFAYGYPNGTRLEVL